MISLSQRWVFCSVVSKTSNPVVLMYVPPQSGEKTLSARWRMVVSAQPHTGTALLQGWQRQSRIPLPVPKPCQTFVEFAHLLQRGADTFYVPPITPAHIRHRQHAQL